MNDSIINDINKNCELKNITCIWILLIFINGCSSTVLQLNHFCNFKTDHPDICSQIEKNGLYVENPSGILDVYYLAKTDSLNNYVYVGYFIEWQNEYPDFGKTYETSTANVILQATLPIFYTNWLYIPNSGGIQRLLYGKHDIEGIFSIYSILNDSLHSLIFLTFELPGHKEIQIPDIEMKIEIPEVSHQKAPFIKVASWNHLFGFPINKEEVQHFLVKPFPKKKWGILKMNNQRAEIAKRYLYKYKGYY